jgi:zinc and cadmium transporter
MTGVLYAVLAGLGDIAGGAFVVFAAAGRRRLLGLLVGFGAGFMLAVALVEMLPVAVRLPHGLVVALGGYLVVHMTQHALTPHFHFGEETHAEAMVSRSVGVWALVGLLPHSFFDGVAISSGFGQSNALGLLVFAAIVLHKVPTGVSLASVMCASGHAAGRAMLAVAAIATATVAGAVVTPAFAPLMRYGLAIAAGVTLYVAASNLIPEAQHGGSRSVHVGILGGVAAFYVLRAALAVGV